MPVPGLSLGSTTDTAAVAGVGEKQKTILNRPGKDTLDEIREKDNFFKACEIIQ